MDQELEFAKWFPFAGRKSSGRTAQLEYDFDGQQRVNLLCFHGAGADSTVYSGRGSKLRPMANPLLDFCAENAVRLLAVHLPGRTYRAQEQCLRSTTKIAEAVLEQLERAERRARAAGQPPQVLFLPDDAATTGSDASSLGPALVVAGHSMGALCAYEFTQLLLQRGFGPVPRRLLVGAMIAPDVPVVERPWRPAKGLDETALQNECRRWGADPALFQPHVWSAYGPVLGADFEALDSFEPRGVNPKLPHVAVTAFYASQDAVISRDAVAGWGRLITQSQSGGALSDSTIPQGSCSIKGSAKSSTSYDERSTASSTTGEELAAPLEENLFELVELPDATHNFLTEPEPRVAWMRKVIDVLDGVLIDLDYSF